MNFQDYVSDYIETSFSDSELCTMWNEYCDNNNDPDSCIYQMSEIDELVSTDEKSAIEVWRMFSSDFNPNSDFFTFDIYGIESFDYVSERVYFSDLAEYAVNYGLDGLDLLDPLKEFLGEEFVQRLSEDKKRCYESFSSDFEDFLIGGDLSDLDEFDSVEEKLQEFFEDNEMAEEAEAFGLEIEA